MKNKEAYLDKIREHFKKDIYESFSVRGDSTHIDVFTPGEMNLVASRAAWYGMYWEENYDYVMENW